MAAKMFSLRFDELMNRKRKAFADTFSKTTLNDARCELNP